MLLEDLANIRQEIPCNSPVDPAELDMDCEFRFDCRKELCGFNARRHSVRLIMNRQWRHIMIEKRLSGPTAGRSSERSLQLFDMCGYDMDSFRKYLQSDGFTEVFDLGQEQLKVLVENEDERYLSACRFLKQVVYGEQSILVHGLACEARMVKRRHRQAATEEEKIEA